MENINSEIKKAKEYLNAMHQTGNANKEDCENVKMHINNVSNKLKSFNLEAIKKYIKWAEMQYKENRGGVIMYDVKGSHKWLTESELLNHWLFCNNYS